MGNKSFLIDKYIHVYPLQTSRWRFALSWVTMKGGQRWGGCSHTHHSSFFIRLLFLHLTLFVSVASLTLSLEVWFVSFPSCFLSFFPAASIFSSPVWFFSLVGTSTSTASPQISLPADAHITYTSTSSTLSIHSVFSQRVINDMNLLLHLQW